ncbi:hypothetical protein V8E36_008180 [Tilletia maclaganii]
MAAHQTDYAFKTPYSQSSFDRSQGRAPADEGGHHPSASAAYNDELIQDDEYDDDDGLDRTPAKDRTELYSNTLSNNDQQQHDYPTRSAAAASGAQSKSYAGVGRTVGGAAYGRKGIWTQADRTAFSRRSAGAKVFRSILCVLLVGLIIALSAVLLLITFVRPPNAAVGAISSNETIPALGRTSLQFNMSIDITVSNPNAISATISSLDATGYDLVKPDVAVGTGRIADVRIAPKSNTTFSMPFQVNYDASNDGDRTIIHDIATKCGWLPGTSVSPLSFRFDIKTHLSVLSLGIPFSFSVSPTFTCPIPASAIQSIVGSVGGSLGDILRALGVTGSRRALSGEERTADETIVGRNLLLGTAETRSSDLDLRDVRFAELLASWRKRAFDRDTARTTHLSQARNDL